MSGGATSIDDLPVGGSDENVVLQTTENVIVESKVEDVKRQRDADLAAAKPQENEVMDMNEFVGSSRVDLQACKLEYSIVSPK